MNGYYMILICVAAWVFFLEIVAWKKLLPQSLMENWNVKKNLRSYDSIQIVTDNFKWLTAIFTPCKIGYKF